MHIHLDFYTPFIYFHKITVLSREYSVNPTVVMTEMGQMKDIFNMTVLLIWLVHGWSPGAGSARDPGEQREPDRGHDRDGPDGLVCPGGWQSLLFN